MVLLNYQKFIEDRLNQQGQRVLDQRLKQACKDKDMTKLLIKLYQYCQQINIIQQRMDILAKQTQKLQLIVQNRKGIKPQLLESQVIKIEQKTKEISSYYSIFLFKQQKFKIAREESIFYENVIKLICYVMKKCFNVENYQRLKKEINRLLRTNTFNKSICWHQFVQKGMANPNFTKKKKKLIQTDFRGFRRSVMNQKSEIRPYVNNRSCFRTKLTRSPMISLLFPTSQYTSFNLSRRNFRSLRK